LQSRATQDATPHPLAPALVLGHRALPRTAPRRVGSAGRATSDGRPADRSGRATPVSGSRHQDSEDHGRARGSLAVRLRRARRPRQPAHLRHDGWSGRRQRREGGRARRAARLRARSGTAAVGQRSAARTRARQPGDPHRRRSRLPGVRSAGREEGRRVDGRGLAVRKLPRAHRSGLPDRGRRRARDHQSAGMAALLVHRLGAQPVS
jgi:hypothetical protein